MARIELPGSSEIVAFAAPVSVSKPTLMLGAIIVVRVGCPCFLTAMHSPLPKYKICAAEMSMGAALEVCVNVLGLPAVPPTSCSDEVLEMVMFGAMTVPALDNEPPLTFNVIGLSDASVTPLPIPRLWLVVVTLPPFKLRVPDATLAPTTMSGKPSLLISRIISYDPPPGMLKVVEIVPVSPLAPRMK